MKAYLRERVIGYCHKWNFLFNYVSISWLFTTMWQHVCIQMKPWEIAKLLFHKIFTISKFKSLAAILFQIDQVKHVQLIFQSLKYYFCHVFCLCGDWGRISSISFNYVLIYLFRHSMWVRGRSLKKQMWEYQSWEIRRLGG